MKYQTEAEAFRAIAEKFITGKRTYPNYGICAELVGLRNAREIDHAIDCSARTRCYGYVGDSMSYAYGTDLYTFGAVKNNEARALACLWMALEAEEEGK